MCHGLGADLVPRTQHPATCGRKLAAGLRRVLGYIHSQKKHRGVDEMLARLYEPILWRAFKGTPPSRFKMGNQAAVVHLLRCHVTVPNPQARVNAAALLIDAFPIVNMVWSHGGGLLAALEGSNKPSSRTGGVSRRSGPHAPGAV